MFPDETKPAFDGYRLQLPPDARWTEWRPITQKVTEPYVLSLQVTETVTKEQLKEFMLQFTVEGAAA